MSYGYGGKGGRRNPFDDREEMGGGYGGGGYGSDNVEMAPLSPNPPPYSNNQNSALDEIAEINAGIDTIDRNLEALRQLQQRALDDVDNSGSSSTNRQLDNLSSETMAAYRQLTQRVRVLKSNPQNQQRFGQQVRRVDSRLKDAIRAYQQVESAFRKRTQDQMARQYRIVRPDASDDEIRAVVEDQSGGQVFQQALMQSNRRGQAQSVLNAVQDRHAQLQKIERQMMELTQLFQDMDVLVVQQEEAIVTIEQKGEEVVDNLDKGNIEVGTAVNTARATRKKKWWCLGICVAIILIIVIIVVVYIEVTKGGGNKKRSLPELDVRALLEGEAGTAGMGAAKMVTSRINAETRRWLMSTTT